MAKWLREWVIRDRVRVRVRVRAGARECNTSFFFLFFFSCLKSVVNIFVFVGSVEFMNN